jgi:hypothetical protein
MEEKKIKKKNPTQKVSPENLERIANVGRYGESFNDVLGRLLDLKEDIDRSIKPNEIISPETDELKELIRKIRSKGYHDVDEYYKD